MTLQTVILAAGMGSRLGRSLLAAMSLFWVGRTIEQFIFLRINDRRVHALTALFAPFALYAYKRRTAD